MEPFAPARPGWAVVAQGASPSFARLALLPLGGCIRGGCVGASAVRTMSLDPSGHPRSVRSVMDGLRGRDDPAWRGWRSQHTFRCDGAQRAIGLAASEWPAHGGWPWEGQEC